MCEHRRWRAERLKQQHVLRRVRDVIVSSNHVIDLHLHIVHDDREVVGGVAVRAEQHEVFDAGGVELDWAVDRVDECRAGCRDLETNRAWRACGLELGNAVRRKSKTGAIVLPRLAALFRLLALQTQAFGEQ